MTSKLLQPIQVGNLTFKNRIMFPPLTTGYEMYKKLADALHEHDCKVALQLFHPEYDVQGVGKMIMEAGIAGQLAAKAKAANDLEEAEKQQKICDELTKGAYAKLHHDMQHN